MSFISDLPAPAAPWHTLLAPLPDDAAPQRERVAPAVADATPEGAAIAGWEQLALTLSAGAAGLRTLLVVLDRTGRPNAASDHVLYRVERDSAEGGVIEYHHANIGGRLEPDGIFRGTRWRTEIVEDADGEQVRSTSVPSEPSAADIEALQGLVAELMRRAPPRGEE